MMPFMVSYKLRLCHSTIGSWSACLRFTLASRPEYLHNDDAVQICRHDVRHKQCS